MIPGNGVGPDHPESGEKLSLVLSVYRAADFEAAKKLSARILAHQGAGHSIGLHTRDDARAVGMGLEMPTCRVIVNQAHCFATGGSFDNGLPFSLSMGCGSWGGNSIDDNLNYRHFMNTTKVVRTIAANEPAVEDIFSATGSRQANEPGRRLRYGADQRAFGSPVDRLCAPPLHPTLHSSLIRKPAPQPAMASFARVAVRLRRR